MKKILSLLCTAAVALSLLSGCGQTQQPEQSAAPETQAAAETVPAAQAQPVRIAAMKGPTAMGLVHFMDQADRGALTDGDYHFTIAASGDEVVPALARGELDLAAVPANLASVVYNKTQGGIQVLGINTLGVLYILESGDSVHSIEDLRGRTIYATGKNHTPEQVLTYLLAQNGMEIGRDVTVEWKAEAAEALSAMAVVEDGIVMLPQPFASAVQMKSDKIRTALDLTAEWDRLQAGSENPSTLVTGVVVGRRDFIEAHPDTVSAFLDHYRQSVDFVNSNVDEAAALIDQYGIVKAPVAKKAVPACNIVFLEGSGMQTRLGGYLQVLFDQDPKSVGGSLPGEDFYFAR